MFCRKCGNPVEPRAAACPSCGTPTGVVQTPQVDNGLAMLVPIGRAPLAIAAGYLGIFSLFMIFAPLSLLVSILALRQLRQNPELKGKGRAIFGLVMGLVFTLSLVGLLLR
ncbi:MAG: DUF4190 domain-containing protein [Myxococcota bacterium]|nr:DUF4190 domain-containing protein [Myxococcota bacterium]